MSNSATLNSRLRVLVAKAFRAEKLYGAAKASKQIESHATQTVVSDVAQQLRAKEWQKSHYELRVSLNNILSLGNSKEQAQQLMLLKSCYETRSKEHSAVVKKLADNLKETVERQEFAHVLKITLELIRLKAIAQSSKVICEELHAVLNRSGRNTELSAEMLEKLSEESATADQSDEYIVPENVVSLAERRAVRGR